MSDLNRRDLLKLAGGAAMGIAAGTLGIPVADRLLGGPPMTAQARAGAIDYTRAKAIPTICFGCTTHCGVIGWVQDGRVRRIEGNPLDINARGRICSKANGMISYTYYPDRLLYPLKRVGPRGSGQWKRISWEEALDEIATRLKKIREAGQPERFVFHYGRDKTKGFTSRFTNAFGTPNRLNRRSICSSNRRVPLMSFYGRDFEWETQDLANTKYVINFGANPMEAYQGGLFMMSRLQDARVDHGARLVTFEVRPSATASVSDEYYPIMPGTDGAVAAAMGHVILEEGLHDQEFWQRWVNVPIDTIRQQLASYTPEWAEAESGIPAADIRRIAIEFAQAAPACCTLSNRGSAKHYNGVQADRLIRLLDVLVGNVGKPGGFCLSTLRMWSGHYGQDGLPKISQPGPKPPKPKPFLPDTPQFAELPQEVQDRLNDYPEKWQKKYFGELATPSEYPLSFHWYTMRVGQLVHEYIRQGRAKVDVYMSYTYGASYGYPEANLTREVLLDESLVPFHVAIEIAYSEHAALADMILPEATSLERWDAHSQNSYELVPYTGIRQPLVEPLGEARPVQEILSELARRIGGGMEEYFDFDDLESFYREWYKNVPLSWQELKRRGVWHDSERAKDYELYERPVPEEELIGSRVDRETGIVEKNGKAIGIMKNGQAVRGFPTPSRLIQVSDPIFQEAAQAVGLPLEDPNASTLPVYFKIPGHEALAKDEFILTTFKWNVHTQGRSGHLKYQAEIVHTNPVFMHPDTGRELGVAEGEEIEVTTYRPKGHTYRAGEEEPVGSFRNHVRFLNGMHPRVLASSHHVGHWEHGMVGKAGEAEAKANGSFPGYDPELQAVKDRDLPSGIWWAKSRGGVGGGVHINDALPINPSPLVGGQNWYDNVCRVRKV